MSLLSPSAGARLCRARRRHSWRHKKRRTLPQHRPQAMAAFGRIDAIIQSFSAVDDFNDEECEHFQDEYSRNVLPDKGCRCAHAVGLLDNQHGIDQCRRQVRNCSPMPSRRALYRTSLRDWRSFWLRRGSGELRRRCGRSQLRAPRDGGGAWFRRIRHTASVHVPLYRGQSQSRCSSLKSRTRRCLGRFVAEGCRARADR